MFPEQNIFLSGVKSDKLVNLHTMIFNTFKKETVNEENLNSLFKCQVPRYLTIVMQQYSENKYFDSQISIPAAFPSSTIVKFLYPWPVTDTLRLTNISLFFSAPTIDKFKIWRRKILPRFF